MSGASGKRGGAASVAGRTNRLPLSADNGYSVGMEFGKGQRPASIEVIEEDMARIIRAKTGAERLRIASGMYASARKMLLSHLRAEHAEWDERRIQQEAARRLSHGAT
jgi:Rv0078B-related antitoxin